MSSLKEEQTTELTNASFVNFSPIENITVGDTQRDETIARVEVGVLAIIFILTIIGNTCVLVALAVRRTNMTRMYYFLLHLCISDLITAFFHVLPQLAWDAAHRFYGGNVLCKVVKYLQILGPYLSSYVLMVTAIDRYQAICFPLTRCTWTPRRSKLMIVGAWIISILCCSPQAFIFSYQQVSSDPLVFDCWGTFIQPWGEKVYVLWYTISQFFIPLLVITFTYVNVTKTVWNNYYLRKKNFMLQTSTYNSGQSREDSGPSIRPVILLVGRSYRFKGRGQVEICHLDDLSTIRTNCHENISEPRSHCRSVPDLSRAKVKTIRITIVVIACYIICSTPFLAVQLWAYWSPYAQNSPIWKGPTVAILMLLASLNSCVNPWIYLAFNHNLITALKQLCCRSVLQDYMAQSTEATSNNNNANRSYPTENEVNSSYPLSFFIAQEEPVMLRNRLKKKQ
ncbi:oxytocin receptor-like [Limulus polyphemus]|uniref:Oxytocin receptor-like n=1 Tax=Limulus polyphemus TaxID=6850 RepID=A0ABM1STP8_LIMPO|nr:oxytocin receptor-like [Limulus polyphemus]